MRTLLACLLLLATACGSSTSTKASEVPVGVDPPTPATATPPPLRSAAPAPAAKTSKCEDQGGRCQSALQMNVCTRWQDGADWGCGAEGTGCCWSK